MHKKTPEKTIKFPVSQPLAPIVLFVYNRAVHTRYTLESLSKNEEAANSDLFVYCDGPKQPEDEKAVQEVRAIVKSRKWCGEVHVIERDENIGLASSIITGVTDIVNQYGCIIVLEDDLVLSPQFLSFMNNALDVYQNSPRVMHISGYMFPVKGELPETFFYRATSCWGWATWKRAWKKFEPDVNKLLGSFHDKNQRWGFDIEGSMQYYKMLQNQATDNIDSWAIRWYASVFFNRGLCLHPGKSLVNNIGHDGSGVHCELTNAYTVTINSNRIAHFTKELVENKKAIKLMTDFYRKSKKSFPLRIINKIQRIINAS